jgi:predicted PurR-regulated permease PerM
MSDFWSKSIKVVGLPGVVLYIFYYLIDKIFDEKITNLLGINKVFVLILIILFLLGAFFIYSTFKTSKPLTEKIDDNIPKQNASVEDEKLAQAPTAPISAKVQTVEYRDDAKHEGDNNFS